MSKRTAARAKEFRQSKPDLPESVMIPVWLHATESFYKKLNRVAKECGVSRYEALSNGLDALKREYEIQTSPLNKVIKSPSQSEIFRRTMGQVSRKYWATLSPEQKRARAQKSAQARWHARDRFPNGSSAKESAPAQCVDKTGHKSSA